MGETLTAKERLLVAKVAELKATLAFERKLLGSWLDGAEQAADAWAGRDVELDGPAVAEVIRALTSLIRRGAGPDGLAPIGAEKVDA